MLRKYKAMRLILWHIHNFVKLPIPGIQRTSILTNGKNKMIKDYSSD